MRHPRQIVIETGDQAVKAVLYETPTADLIWAALPVGGTSDRWGEELFFDLPLDVDLEPDAHQIVAPGSLCFWCEGRILSIALGPTPISLGRECRLAAPVNVWGRLDDDGGSLSRLRRGEPIRLERWDP